VQATTVRPRITVTTDGQGVASHAGTRLLGDLADAAGMTAAFSDALAGLRQRRSCHDPGRVLVDVAVMLADGGEAISDLAVLRDQPGLFGTVASTATAWRVLDGIDERALTRVRTARAVARERAWLLRAEAGRDLPASSAGGWDWPGLVLDIDATVVEAHSEKQGAAAHFKGGLASIPCWCGWPTPTRRWPGCCGPETPARILPPTTSRSPIWPWRRSPTSTATAARS
jgi:hypothetical protein